MRKKLVAGNWKSFLRYDAAMDLLSSLTHHLTNHNDNTVEVVVFPPAIYLESAVRMAAGAYGVGAQNCSSNTEGAYTGEVTANMLTSVGVQHILTGHSERRQLFGESNDVVKDKINRITEAGATPFFCCGETLEARQAQLHKKVVEAQLQASLFHLSEDDFNKVVIAYEPVWAIGTGVNATAAQAQEMHAFIRETVAQQYSKETAASLRILYGGSVKPENAAELFSCADVDGALVGGASLKLNDFVSIIHAAKPLL